MAFSSIYSSLLILGLLSTSVISLDPPKPLLRNIFTFPPNHFIENIAVRSNSDLLLTSLSVNTLFSVDPTITTPNATVVHTFPAGHGLMGITELSPDVFVIVSGIWDLALTRARLGTLTVWSINFRSQIPIVKNITTITTSIQLNGLAPVPGSKNLILAADSDAGSIYLIDISTGAYSVTFSSPLFTPVNRTLPGQHLGINGLRTKGNDLYFTNSARQHYGRLPINTLGQATGPIQIISNNTIVGGAFGSQYDDFAVDGKDNAWVATHPNHVVKVMPGGKQVMVEDLGLLLNPTSAQFGRGSEGETGTLYVTNGGRFLEDGTLVDEGVVALDTGLVVG